MVLRILNIEDDQFAWSVQNLRRFNDFFCPWLIRFFFGSGTSLLWKMGESAGEGLWLLAMLTGGRWYVTCDMWLVRCHTWHMTCDMCQTVFFLTKSARKDTKSPKKATKMAKKCTKMQNSAKNAVFHSFGATICRRCKSRCLSYSGFWLLVTQWHLLDALKGKFWKTWFIPFT